MDRRKRFAISGVLLAIALFALSLAFAHSPYAQEAGSLEPDDGFSLLGRGEVIELQKLLGQFGYDAGRADGVVGPKTVAAVKALAGVIERDFVRQPSGQEIVLSCDILEGSTPEFDSTQIMIDEHRAIAIYHYQLKKDLNPIRKSGDGYVDLSLKITMNNEHVLVAHDSTSILAIA